MALDPSIWVAAIAAVPALGGVLATHAANRAQASKTKALVGEVHEQVRNSHSTNLRDDLDQLLAGVADIRGEQQEQGGEIRALRSELAAERKERADLSRRVDHLYTEKDK